MGKGKKEQTMKRKRVHDESDEDEVFYGSKRRPKQKMGIFKWFFRTLLTQIGCISSEESLCGTGTDSLDYLLPEPQHSESPTAAPQGQRPPELIPCKRESSCLPREQWVGIDGSPSDGSDEECDDFLDRHCDKDTNTMSIQNCTLLAQNGPYSASFTEKSFKRGRRFKVYSGIYVGDGGKRGEKCVVKVFNDVPGTRNLCCCEASKNEKARKLAREYNNQMQNNGFKIRINYLYWAPIDEISLFKKLFFSGKRRLSTKELVLFEDDLRVNDDKPGKLRKLILYMDSIGRLPVCKAKDLVAFTHFTYHCTDGDLVMCGLEGVQDSDGFLVKTPTIHSRNRNYGSSDLGIKGIEKFFEHHVCNELCRDMIKYNREMELQAAEEDEAEALRLDDNRRMPADETDHRPQLRRSSTMSCNTERMSDYLEPTAPFIDEPEVPISPQPPILNGASSWVPREQAYLFNMVDAQSRRVFPQMSVDSEMSDNVWIDQTMSAALKNANMSLASLTTEQQANCNTRASSVIAASRPNSVASLSFFDDGYGRSEPTDMASSACATPGGHRVRFSDSGVDTSTNFNGETSVSSSPKVYPRGIMKRQASLPAPPLRCSSNVCEESMGHIIMMQVARRPSLPEHPEDHLLNPGADVVPDNPPSYTQSQRDFILNWMLENHGLHFPAMDANGNQVLPTLANARHL